MKNLRDRTSDPILSVGIDLFMLAVAHERDPDLEDPNQEPTDAAGDDDDRKAQRDWQNRT